MYEFLRNFDQTKVTREIEKDLESLIPSYGMNEAKSSIGSHNNQQVHPNIQFNGPADYFAQRLFNTRMSLR